MACTQIFIIAKKLKKNSECINEIWHIHTMEYYKNEVHIIKCYNGGESKKIMLSKKKKIIENHILHDSIYVKYSEKANL